MLSYEELTEIEALCTKSAEFKKYIDRLEDENNQLLSNIVHEIGNPLTIIYSTIQLMETKEPSIRSYSYWDQLKNDVRDLSYLLQNYSNSNNCTLLNYNTENLLDMFYLINKSFEPVLTKKDIQLHLDIAEDMMSAITAYWCDALKLRQVFTNIVKNGMEAIEENGTIQITVPPAKEKVQDLIQGVDYLIIIIKNNGTPLTEEALKKIFISQISSKHKRYGIGLSISKKIIEAHDGIIYANSTEGQTEFIICLPL